MSSSHMLRSSQIPQQHHCHHHHHNHRHCQSQQQHNNHDPCLRVDCHCEPTTATRLDTVVDCSGCLGQSVCRPLVEWTSCPGQYVAEGHNAVSRHSVEKGTGSRALIPVNMVFREGVTKCYNVPAGTHQGAEQVPAPVEHMTKTPTATMARSVEAYEDHGHTKRDVTRAHHIHRRSRLIGPGQLLHVVGDTTLHDKRSASSRTGSPIRPRKKKQRICNGSQLMDVSHRRQNPIYHDKLTTDEIHCTSPALHGSMTNLVDNTRTYAPFFMDELFNFGGGGGGSGGDQPRSSGSQGFALTATAGPEPLPYTFGIAEYAW